MGWCMSLLLGKKVSRAHVYFLPCWAENKKKTKSERYHWQMMSSMPQGDMWFLFFLSVIPLRHTNKNVTSFPNVVQKLFFCRKIRKNNPSSCQRNKIILAFPPPSLYAYDWRQSMWTTESSMLSPQFTWTSTFQAFFWTLWKYNVFIAVPIRRL